MAVFASFSRYIYCTFTSKATFIILCYVAPYWFFSDMEIDYLEWPFCVKSVSDAATNGLASPAFGKMFKNFERYPYTVSDENVAQGT